MEHRAHIRDFAGVLLSGGRPSSREEALRAALGSNRAFPATQRLGPDSERCAPASLWDQFRPGQLLELSGCAPGKLSTVASLIARAQAQGEPVAWVAVRGQAGFYPPDFARAGIDLAALVVVRVPPEQGVHALVRAGELLLRSGAFGLLVLDFAAAPLPRSGLAWQARLASLIRRHEARGVLLTSARRDEPSLGPLIGLRVEPEISAQGACAVLRQRVLKSKLGFAAALSPDLCAPPPGAVRSQDDGLMQHPAPQSQTVIEDVSV